MVLATSAPKLIRGVEYYRVYGRQAVRGIARLLFGFANLQSSLARILFHVANGIFELAERFFCFARGVCALPGAFAVGEECNLFSEK
jgi:hypothetical protein